jgi:hypothetical protein
MTPPRGIGGAVSGGELDELTPDCPLRTDRFSGEQLAGNAHVVVRVPFDVRAVGVDEPLLDERPPALANLLTHNQKRTNPCPPPETASASPRSKNS